MLAGAPGLTRRGGGVMSPDLVESPPRSIERDHPVSLDQRMGPPQLHPLLSTCQVIFENQECFRDARRSWAPSGWRMPCGSRVQAAERAAMEHYWRSAGSNGHVRDPQNDHGVVTDRNGPLDRAFDPHTGFLDE